MQFCDLVQVEVIRDHLRAKLLGKGDQLAVDLADPRKIILRNAHLHVAHLLDAVQNIEPPPAPGPLERIGGIGNVLQFLQDELGDDDRSVEELCFADVGNPAVDDHAGVHDLDVLLRRALEKFLEVRGIEALALPHAHGDAKVPEKGVQQENDKINDLLFQGNELQRRCNDVRCQQAGDESQDASRYHLQRNPSEYEFSKNDENSDAEPDGHAFELADLVPCHGGDVITGKSAEKNEKKPNNDKTHSRSPPFIKNPSLQYLDIETSS